MFSVEFERHNPKDYDKLLRRACERFGPLAGAAVRASAVLQVPVQTGNLRGSITWRTSRESGGFGGGNVTGADIETPSDEFTVHVGTNVDYSQHVEYGTRRSEGKPYLRPALDEQRSGLVRMLKRLFGEEARRG